MVVLKSGLCCGEDADGEVFLCCLLFQGFQHHYQSLASGSLI